MTSESTSNITQEKFPPPILSVPPINDQPKPNMTPESIIQERRELAEHKTDKGTFTDITILGVIAVVAFIFLVVKGH